MVGRGSRGGGVGCSAPTIIKTFTHLFKEREGPSRVVASKAAVDYVGLRVGRMSRGLGWLVGLYQLRWPRGWCAPLAQNQLLKK
jgi:hypothetical protein